MRRKAELTYDFPGRCIPLKHLDFDFLIAFQPIVDCIQRKIVGYEALVRGEDNRDADWVLNSINQKHLYSFDQLCRNKAIEQASRLDMSDKFLSINFLPNAIRCSEDCISSTLDVAKQYNFPIENIVFEFTESEKIRDIGHFKHIINAYKQHGFKTAIDDFGSGYAGLGLLAELQTNIVKFDMALIRNIHSDFVRQTIFTHSLNMLNQLNIDVIAEGVESKQEMLWLLSAGVRFMQGYYFAKPQSHQLPTVHASLFELH